MSKKYIFVPANPNLRHCSDLLFSVIKSQANIDDFVYLLTKVQIKSIWILIQQVFMAKLENEMSVLFLAVQSDYLVLLIFLKLTCSLFNRQVKVYYLMHEPRLERGRISFVKSFAIFIHQFMFGYFADVILLPSDEAIAKAESFVEKSKLHKVNLTFASVSQMTLEKNLTLLKCSWRMQKTFSMLGTVSSLDKNPQGFLNFVSVFDQLYPEQAHFIRGGRDRGIQVQYDENLIIRFPSYLPDNTKRFLFGLSHFVIIPYSFSTQSGVVAEALSYGKLLILNDIPAFSYLKKYSFTFFVDFNNKDELTQCVNKLLAMSLEDFESCYWKAVDYFNANHSEEYLRNALSGFMV